MRNSLAPLVLVLLVRAEALNAQLPPGGWVPQNVTSPVSRIGLALAGNSAGGNMLLFGGYGGLQDTWTWTGSAWQQEVPAARPPARWGAAMAFDSARNRFMLFGGNTSATSTPNLLNDAWEWDPNGRQWLSIASPSRPTARYLHEMVFDAARGRTLLFGGASSISLLSAESWEWDGINWSQATAPGPAARFSHAMAYDSRRGKVILYGGRTLTAYLTDTWERTGTSWSQVFPSHNPGVMPPWNGIASGTAAFDDIRGQTHLVANHATWSWNGSDWLPQERGAFSFPFVERMAWSSIHRRLVSYGTDGVNNPDTAFWSGWPSLSTYFSAPGCGQLEFVTLNHPTIGTSASATLSRPSRPLNPLSGFGFVIAGFAWQTTNLTNYGMANCYSYVAMTPSVVSPMLPVLNGIATFSLPIPNSTQFLGFGLCLQGWATDASTAAGLISSNPVLWTIGG